MKYFFFILSRIRPPFLFLFLFILFPSPPLEAASYPDKPMDKMLLDVPESLSPFSSTTINLIATRLLMEKKIPVHVVLLPSLEVYQAGELDLEDYAEGLFDDWEIGGEYNDKGILLLAAQKTRDVAIKSGNGWDITFQSRLVEIKHRMVVPFVENGEIYQGLGMGIKAIDALLRGLPMPDPRPWWKRYRVVLGSILLVGVLCNLLFRYRESWIWVVLPYVGAFFYLVESAMESGEGGGGSTTDGDMVGGFFDGGDGGGGGD